MQLNTLDTSLFRRSSQPMRNRKRKNLYYQGSVQFKFQKWVCLFSLVHKTTVLLWFNSHFHSHLLDAGAETRTESNCNKLTYDMKILTHSYKNYQNAYNETKLMPGLQHVTRKQAEPILMLFGSHS